MDLLPTAPLEAYWASLLRFKATKNRVERRALGAALRRWRRTRITHASRNWLATLAVEAEASPAWQQWFWFNHFNVVASKRQIAPVLDSYLQSTIARHSQGRFSELLQAVSLHPAMLMYLDNIRNVKGKGNENHARELLELHTLGVGGGYSQADVVAASKIMTGWGVRLRGDPGAMGTTEFNARRHEGGTKRVLGRTFQPDGAGEFPALLTHLAAQPATAKHLARKVAIWMLDDEPKEEHVSQLAAVYTRTSGHLPTLWAEAIQLQSDLRSTKTRNHQGPGKFKDPLRYLSSATKLLLGDEPVSNARPLERWLRLLGEPMFARGSPDGYPLEGSDWLSAGQVSQRIELAQGIVAAAPRLGNASAIRRNLQRGPMDSPQAALTMKRLSQAEVAAVKRASDPALAWALVLASPSFMYV